MESSVISSSDSCFPPGGHGAQLARTSSATLLWSPGMLDMLLDTELSATQKDYAQTAQVCGKALISLINEVLDRAKIEAGKLEMEAVPFDIRSVLDDVISLFSAKSGIEASPGRFFFFSFSKCWIIIFFFLY